MDHRNEVADYLEKNRAEIAQQMEGFRASPVVVSSKEGVPEDESFGAVLLRPSDIDLLVKQLRAKKVSKGEALDPTLVR